MLINYANSNNNKELAFNCALWINYTVKHVWTHTYAHLELTLAKRMNQLLHSTCSDMLQSSFEYSFIVVVVAVVF